MEILSSPQHYLYNLKTTSSAEAKRLWRRKIKGYNKLDPKENEGQCQSSFKEFNKKYEL